MVNPLPDGYQQVTPYLVVDGAKGAIDFYVRVLGVTERMRMDGPGDRIGHAELELGSSVIMLADEFPEMDIYGPKPGVASPVSVMLYVEDADALFGRAVEAGAKALQPMEEKFYGDRAGTFEDPFGHRWTVATHVEDVTPDEMAKRAAEEAAAMGGG